MLSGYLPHMMTAAQAGVSIVPPKRKVGSEQALQWLSAARTPFLVLSAIVLFGISLNALASGFLSVAALLACPVGMYLMMRTMTKDKK
jgi:hypothetical protein